MASMNSGIENIKQIVIILSGKGGVGKSTTVIGVLLALHRMGKKVGVLDIDLCGPSIPHMLGVNEQEVHSTSDGAWVPVYVQLDKQSLNDCTHNPISTKNSIVIMSIGFLLPNKSDAVIWRGPKKNAIIHQFLDDVRWGELDYLLIDTPPGTSDEHMSIIEAIKKHEANQNFGAVLVTTPQRVAVGDVRRELTFCRKLQIPVYGIIENMSGFTCPNCSHCTNVFSKDGGKGLAEKFDIPFLGALPIDLTLVKSLETGIVKNVDECVSLVEMRKPEKDNVKKDEKVECDNVTTVIFDSVARKLTEIDLR